MKKAPNFFIHYELDESESIDLDSFGKSIIGFNWLLKEIFEITKIDADLEIRAIQPKKGSIIVQLLIEVWIHHQYIFNNLPDLQNFLQTIDSELLNQANEYFSAAWYSQENELWFWQKIIAWDTEIQRDFNTFADKRPWEFWAYSGISIWLLYKLLPKFYLSILEQIRRVKNREIPDKDIPRKYFPRLKKLTKKTKKAVKPIREWIVSQIWFSLDWKKEHIDKKSIIDSRNLWEILPDKEEVLSEYKNGVEYEFTWEIRNFQSSRGDFMKIQVKTEHGKYLLTAKPWDKHTTKEFIEFYKEQVKFRAEILRDSLYQLPKIKIIPWSMELTQKNLF